MDSLVVRKIVTVVDETRLVAGRADDGPPLRRIAVAAVIRNPYAGKGFCADLDDLIEPSAALGTEIGSLACDALGAAPESYGKGGIAGLAGEQEHANACLTSTFGNALRDAIGGGRAWISSATKVGPPGCAIDVPLAYKDEIWVRSHYDALEVRIPDAPLPEELVVIAAVANRGRINARLGGMTVEAARAEANT